MGETDERRKEVAVLSIGAVIVAAGNSSGAGGFQPVMKMGSISIARRVVSTLHQAGIRRIVVVTGQDAEALEHDLANLGLVFLHNDRYACTGVLSSVQIGLSYLKDKCARVFLVPVDAPLFTAGTVRTLMASRGPVVSPVYHGHTGHPMLVDSTVIDSFLSDPEDGDWSDTVSRVASRMTVVPVEDAGILYDAETEDDYSKLLDTHNRQLVRQSIRVSLTREFPFFDEKTSMLLSLVDETASVREACSQMKISYSTGWNIIRTLESQLHCPLLERIQGGVGGGESRLTEKGRKLVDDYNRYVRQLSADATEMFEEYFGEDLQ